MLNWEHGGFSLDANVLIQHQDREGLERLIRYCARPIFSGERLEFIGEKLRYPLSKPLADVQTVLLLKPSELLDKLAGWQGVAWNKLPIGILHHLFLVIENI